MKLYKLVIFILCLNLTACTGTGQKVVASDPDNAGISRLAKSDIHEVIELHQRAVMQDLKSLMFKLYKRNPAGRHDKNKRDIKTSVDLFFSHHHHHYFPHWQHLDATDIIRIALDETYQGSDRVLPFIFGMRKMMMASYDNHTEFFYFTSIDQQKLYNSARNIEIAAWMLAEKRDINGKLLLLSDSLTDEYRNLSYQRIFGEMIATQDNLAEIIARKNGRLIKTVMVRAASMMFLPI
ncbi:MAG: hypothetical protein COA83_03155 [Methylophaga sp.]|nr:MAG: hypothetical protein COA83_03155 [Methylophaga sp.]